MFYTDNRALPLRRTPFVSQGIRVAIVRPSTRGWSNVAGGIGLMIILLTLSCASRSKMFDHPALADEGSASAELTIIQVRGSLGPRANPICRKIDGELIVCLQQERYATVRLRPGHYRLSAGYLPAYVINMEATEIDLEAGEAAYVVIRAKESTIVTPEEGKALMRENKRIGED
jgi:hypothetical protein